MENLTLRQVLLLRLGSIAKLAIAGTLSTSVLALVLLKMVDVQTYINLVVVPGLSYLGVHTALMTPPPGGKP